MGRNTRADPVLVVRWYRQGHTIEKIADYFGASRVTIRAILDKESVERLPHTGSKKRHVTAVLAEKAGVHWTPEEDKELACRIAWGFTHKEVARQIGRSVSACKIRLKRLGLTDSTGQRRRDRLDAARSRKKSREEKLKIGRKSARRANRPGVKEDFAKRMHDPSTRAVAIAKLRLTLRGYEVPPEREEEYRYYKKTKKMTPAEIRGIMGL